MTDLPTTAKRWRERNYEEAALLDADAFALADFAASLLDETALDATWLMSIGAEYDGVFGGYAIDSDCGRRDIIVFRSLVGVSASYVSDGDCTGTFPAKTRGQFRTLAFALQIPLQENNDG